MNEQSREAVSDVFAPGNIVRLRKPYKPDGMDRAWLGKRAEWHGWSGYTHGIITEVISRVNGPATQGRQAGDITRVSLHLYDPERALLYFHDNGCAVPVYVDHHVDELRPHKVAADPGYASLPEVD